MTTANGEKIHKLWCPARRDPVRHACSCTPQIRASVGTIDNSESLTKILERIFDLEVANQYPLKELSFYRRAFVKRWQGYSKKMTHNT
ncbi:MAG: hypothetical protein ABFS09_03725 [Thermodesulfobacteriota bacterium]